MPMEIETKQNDIIYRSKLPDIFIPNHLPLHSYCFQNISVFSSRPCLINGANNRIYTYADVELSSRKVAAGLHKKFGIQQKDTIMILLPNSPEFVFAFLGASYLGAISTMANPLFTSSEILKQAKASSAKIIVTQACHVSKVKDYALENDVKIVCVDSVPEGCVHFSELIQADEHDIPEVVSSHLKL